jgi:protein-L-isoaspartate(D-aspartate) O-methyltransferase
MSDTASKPPKVGKFPLRLNQLAAAPRLAKAPVNLLKAVVLRPVAAPSAAIAAARAVLRPQALLQHSVDHAANAKSPSGVGLDSADVRERMVERLRASGIQHAVVLNAMARVQRHRFVDSALVIQAYEDTSLPIGHGQTISKPSVVARMIELLMGTAQARASNHLGKVLEIGTGCGYQAAVLACMAKQVVSVERVKALHDKARELLAHERGASMRLVYGDGMLGHAPNAPYDSIIAAAGGDALPDAWLAQLALGGRLVAPVEMGSSRQALVVVDHTERGFERHVFETVQFVPLKSGMVR